MSLKCTMILGDCLDVMPTLACRNERTTLAVLDLPYGTTGLHWDSIAKNKQIAIMTASVMFQHSRLAVFLPIAKMAHLGAIPGFCLSYDLILCKPRSTSIFAAKKQPMRYHEPVYVFQQGQPAFYPQKEPRTEAAARSKSGRYKQMSRSKLFHLQHDMTSSWGDTSYAGSLIIPSSPDDGRGLHPTAKPVDAIRKIINWFTCEGETVIDPVGGSGSTVVAGLLSSRSVVYVEAVPVYFERAVARVKDVVKRNLLDVKIEVIT